MSDPHDREPIDQATIDCWRINYGLDKRTPAEAAKWWSENLTGFAPAGCVAALGIALDEMDALRKDAERYRWLRDGNNDTDGLCPFVAGDDLDAAIDVAMAGGTRLLGDA